MPVREFLAFAEDVPWLLKRVKSQPRITAGYQHLDHTGALHIGPSVCLCRARIHAIVENDDEIAETCTMFPLA